MRGISNFSIKYLYIYVIVLVAFNTGCLRINTTDSSEIKSSSSSVIKPAELNISDTAKNYLNWQINKSVIKWNKTDKTGFIYFIGRYNKSFIGITSDSLCVCSSPSEYDTTFFTCENKELVDYQLTYLDKTPFPQGQYKFSCLASGSLMNQGKAQQFQLVLIDNYPITTPPFFLVPLATKSYISIATQLKSVIAIESSMAVQSDQSIYQLVYLESISNDTMVSSLLSGKEAFLQIRKNRQLLPELETLATIQEELPLKLLESQSDQEYALMYLSMYGLDQNEKTSWEVLPNQPNHLQSKLEEQPVLQVKKAKKVGCSLD